MIRLHFLRNEIHFNTFSGFAASSYGESCDSSSGKSWAPVQNHQVPVQKTKSPINWKCLVCYVTRQLIWRQISKLFIRFTEIKIYSIYCKAQQSLKEICTVKQHPQTAWQKHLQIDQSIDRSLRPTGHMPWIILHHWGFLCVRDPRRWGNKITLQLEGAYIQKSL